LSNYYTGEGINVQLGYLFENNVEPAFRYTAITPEVADLASDRNAQRMYTFGLSKYVVGHALKVQTDLSFIDESAGFIFENEFDMQFRFQVEMAFWSACKNRIPAIRSHWQKPWSHHAVRAFFWVEMEAKWAQNIAFNCWFSAT